MNPPPTSSPPPCTERCNALVYRAATQARWQVASIGDDMGVVVAPLAPVQAKPLQLPPPGSVFNIPVCRASLSTTDKTLEGYAALVFDRVRVGGAQKVGERARRRVGGTA
jgi:hypothetical protein